MAGRGSLAVGLALLVVLAGCSGFAPNAADSDPGETTDGPEIDPDVEPIYEPPLNTTDVAVEHVLALRQAGSFRFNSTVTIAETNQSAAVRYGRTANVDMDSGAMTITRENVGVGTESSYVAGNGTTYYRSPGEQGAVAFDVAEEDIDTSRFAIDGVPRFLDMFALTYDGLTTLDGEEVYRYSASSPEQVDSLVGVGSMGSKDDLESIRAVLYVTEDGLVRELGYSLAFDSGQGTHNIKAVTRYERVGSTTVTEPDWVADARAADRGELDVTRTITNETHGAELTLTAQRPQFEDIRLIAGPGPFYDGDGAYQEAAVSSAVTAVIPPSATNASVRLSYDEAAVPDGEESELALFEYVPTRGGWTKQDAVQDAEADVFIVELNQSAAVVVMHEPSWQAGNETDA